jgi:hypothetical protein
MDCTRARFGGYTRARTGTVPLAWHKRRRAWITKGNAWLADRGESGRYRLLDKAGGLGGDGVALVVQQHGRGIMFSTRWSPKCLANRPGDRKLRNTRDYG